MFNIIVKSKFVKFVVLSKLHGQTLIIKIKKLCKFFVC